MINKDTKKLNSAEILLFLRYLRANSFDLSKTKAHILSNIEWRKTMKIDQIISFSPDQILGRPIEQLTEVFPHWQMGFDRTGRPVLYKRYGPFDAARIKKMFGGNFDRIVRYHGGAKK
jgi:hypothetical protein